MRSIPGWFLSTAAVLTSLGCGESERPLGPDSGGTADAAVADGAVPDAADGGVPGDALAAVGSLYGVRPTGESAPICTGTLIGPHTVLTAAHCVRPSGASADILDGAAVFFAIGEDSAHPDRSVRAVAAARTPVAGHDVGIYQLAEDVVGVAPIRVADAPLTAADIGSTLTAGGYGVRDPDDTWNDFLTRRMGDLAVTTFDPQPLHELFGSLAELQAFMEANAGRTFTTIEAQAIYDDVLLSANDVFVGSPDAELQLKYLDSGGPGLDVFEGALRVRAVHVRSYRADPTAPATGHASDLLPVGSAFAVLGIAGTRELIDESLAAPCRGVPSAGSCSGSTAIHCDAGLVTLVECAETGLACSDAGCVGR